MVTFLVHVAVGVQDQYVPSPRCEECAADDRGKTIGDTTEYIAGTLGCWVDELAVPTFGVVGALLEGIGGLLGGLGGA